MAAIAIVLQFLLYFHYNQNMRIKNQFFKFLLIKNNI